MAKTKRLPFILVFLALNLLGAFIVLTYQDIANMTPSQHMENRDFHAFYVASDIVAKGESRKLYDREQYYEAMQNFKTSRETQHWLYPPSFLPAIEWLSAFSYYEAFILWITLQTVVFFIAAHRFFPTIEGKIILLGIPSVLCCLDWGQLGLFIAALHFLGFYYLRKNPALSGIFWGLATVKPTLGILVPFVLLATHNSKAIIWAVGTAVAIAAISIGLYGLEPWLTYFNIESRADYYLLDKFSVVHYNMPTIHAALVHWKVPVNIAYGVQIASFFICAAITWRMFSDGEITLKKMAVFYILSALATPYLLVYDYILLQVTFIAWFMQRKNYKFVDIAVLFAVLGLVLITVCTNRSDIMISPVLLILLALYIVRERDYYEYVVKLQ